MMVCRSAFSSNNSESMFRDSKLLCPMVIPKISNRAVLPRKSIMRAMLTNIPSFDLRNSSVSPAVTIFCEVNLFAKTALPDPVSKHAAKIQLSFSLHRQASGVNSGSSEIGNP